MVLAPSFRSCWSSVVGRPSRWNWEEYLTDYRNRAGTRLTPVPSPVSTERISVVGSAGPRMPAEGPALVRWTAHIGASPPQRTRERVARRMIRRHLLMLKLALMVADGVSATIVFVLRVARPVRRWRRDQLWRLIGIDLRVAAVLFGVGWVGAVVPGPVPAARTVAPPDGSPGHREGHLWSWRS